MIKNIFEQMLDYVFLVYKDNVVVMMGLIVGCFFFDFESCQYIYYYEDVYILMKVEMYNYLMVILFWLGVLIGFGGEICDEGVTGIGGKFKVGLVGFIILNLCIFGFEQLWESDFGKLSCIVNVLDIMLEGLFGGVVFNNEFGCLNLFGYFCIYEEKVMLYVGEEVCGYYKLIMIAGGMGNICVEYIQKKEILVGVKLIVFGGFVMNIGFGGGVVFLMVFGQFVEDLDFVFVQCENLEMECCCQEVIDCCWQFGDKNLIVFIYDVGVGGIFNVLFELVNDGDCGGKFQLCNVLNDELGMSLLEIWCNEL